MSVPRTDEEIVGDIISFCKEKEIRSADGSYGVEIRACIKHLMGKYDESKEIIIGMFCNMVKDGYIRAIRGESEKIYILVDENL